MRRAILIAVSFILSEVAVAGGASANPIVSLANAAQFAAALQQSPPNPTLQPVSSPNSTQNKAFPNSNNQPTALYPNTSQVNGLVSATGSSANLNSSTPINGGYVYSYHIDPNLYGYFMDLSLFLPQVGAFGAPGIDALGIALTDQNGNAKIWEFDNSVLVAGVSQTFRFNVSDNAGAGGSTSFFMDPGFDISHVVSIQVSDEGTLTNSFPAPPPADSPFPAPPNPTLWFGTEKFATQTPEPGSFGLLATGLLVPGAALLRRRRKG